MLIDELFNVVLADTGCYQQHIVVSENKTQQTDVTIDDIHPFVGLKSTERKRRQDRNRI
jgi:hypothetical protein